MNSTAAFTGHPGTANSPGLSIGMFEGNLFAALPAGLETKERIETLIDHPAARIERIVSSGQASPPGFWYDQPRDEWVVLLSGSAGLRFADAADVRALEPGDWLLIPAGCRHRVEWTDSPQPAVWLAVHFAP